MPMLVSCGLSYTNLHPALGEKRQDRPHHASLGSCWRLLTWLEVCFIQNPLRSHSAGHRPERFNSVERRLSARDLGAGLLTIPLWILCRKSRETGLEIAVRRPACDHVWGSWEQNDEAALGAEWEGNVRTINSLKVIERNPGKQLLSQQRKDRYRLGVTNEGRQVTRHPGMCQAAPQPLLGQILLDLLGARKKWPGLEGSMLWAVSAGCSMPDSAWGNCRGDVPEGAAPRPWPGRKQPLNTTLSCSAPSQQALLCGLTFSLPKWGRENIASSHRFPPTSPVALDKVLERSGAKKLVPSHRCLWAMPISARSAALPRALQNEQLYRIISFGCTWGLCFLQADPPADTERKGKPWADVWTLQHDRCIHQASKVLSRVWRYLPLLVWLQL